MVVGVPEYLNTSLTRSAALVKQTAGAAVMAPLKNVCAIIDQRPASRKHLEPVFIKSEGVK